jgi:DNA-directed RNA polymerase specialized sigma24 family protein
MTAVAFQSQLNKLKEGFMRFALSLTRDKDNTEDLVGGTFLKALENSDKYIFESNFKAWTATIMKNTSINTYRRNFS